MKGRPLDEFPDPFQNYAKAGRAKSLRMFLGNLEAVDEQLDQAKLVLKYTKEQLLLALGKVERRQLPQK